jgi:hypothetical protein
VREPATNALNWGTASPIVLNTRKRCTRMKILRRMIEYIVEIRMNGRAKAQEGLLQEEAAQEGQS